ncbi:MAG TPA: non-homologous end-joining DNA ligase [Candidatus Acidoferrales bacterium]|nr:non-homologous end-joining DNA ligase [Candidatus Acidoferrales bacterium]
MKSKSSAQAGATKLPVEISHPDKVFWPEEGYTKLDLANFYAMVFPKLAPYVKGHLLTMERCPDGMAGQCFYQKQAPKALPAGTPTKKIKGSTRITEYIVGGSLSTQLALVNFGCIAIHAMPGREGAPHESDWLCFDLDPESGNFADAARAGIFVKELLDSIGLTSFPKTSGSRGLHIFVPLKAKHDADDVLKFAHQVANAVAAAHPKETTTEHSIAARKGRVYIDPFRNGFAQTVVTPYSVRRKPHAPVSTPLDWAEIKPTLDPAKFNIGNFAQRLEALDPWENYSRSRQSLAAAAKKLAKV